MLKSPGKVYRRDKLAFIYKTNDMGDSRFVRGHFNPGVTQNLAKFAASSRKVKNPSLSVNKKVGGGGGRYHSIVNTTQGNRRAMGGFKGFDDKLVSSTIVDGRAKGDERRLPLKNKANKFGNRAKVRKKCANLKGNQRHQNYPESKLTKNRMKNKGVGLHKNKGKDYVRKQSRNDRSSDRSERKMSSTSNNNITKSSGRGYGESSRRDNRVSKNSKINVSNAFDKR